MATDFFAAKRAQLAPIGTGSNAAVTTANVTPGTTVKKTPITGGSSMLNHIANKASGKVGLAPVKTNNMGIMSGGAAASNPAPTAPLANAVTSTTTPSTGFGGASYGSGAAANNAIVANQTALKNDPNYVQSEINRTLGVINERKAQGLDTSAQDKYLTTNLGYQAPTGNNGQGTGYDSNIPDWVTAMETTNFNNQLASFNSLKNSYADQLNSALQDNNSYVGQQIDAAQQLQNRRGGLYSGGYDYQAGTLTAEGLKRQADLQSQYGNQMNTVAQQIAELQNNQPDIIRQKIEDYLNQQVGRDATIAGLTGKYQGNDTLAAQNQYFNQNLDTKNANLNAANVYSNLSGQILSPQDNWSGYSRQINSGVDSNGQPINQSLEGKTTASNLTTADQSRDLANRNYALQEWAQAGYATPVVASILGIPEGTSTNDASYRAAAQSLDNDKFTYQQMQDVASAQNKQSQTDTINASTAGDMLSSALQKTVGTDYDGKPVYGVISDPTKREQAFVDLYNNYGISGNDMISALSKAGYTMNEINSLKQHHPEVFQ